MSTNGEPVQIFTGTNFASEAEAMAYFDAEADRSGCFRIYREVPGEYFQPKIGCDDKAARIDRILLPNKKLTDAGWNLGPIGIEGKVSNVNKVISQALDYTRAIWFLPNCYEIHLRWIFLWPFDRQLGAIASVMAQNRIGYVKAYKRTPLVFYNDATQVITVWNDGKVTVAVPKSGNKVGSR